MAEMLKAVYDRQVAGHNALVAIQRWFAAAFNTLSGNIYMIDGKLEDRKSKDIRVDFSDLHLIEFDLDMLDKLLNIDYINELAKFAADLRKLNDTVESLNKMHVEIRSAFLSKAMDAATYQANFQIYLDGLKQTKSFIQDSESEVVRLTAHTRVLLKKQPLFSRILLRIARPSPVAQSDVENELAILKKEMEELTNANRERIKKLRS